MIQPSRGKAVVTSLFGAIQPKVWVSDMLGSQRGRRRTVAGLPGASAARREIRHRMRRHRIQRALPLVAATRHCHRTTARDAERHHPEAIDDLNRRLDRIMAAVPAGDAGRKLHKRMLANLGRICSCS